MKQVSFVTVAVALLLSSLNAYSIPFYQQAEALVEYPKFDRGPDLSDDMQKELVELEYFFHQK